MSEVHVVVVSAEEADDGVAEFWCGSELMGFTTLAEGQLQLRIDARSDGLPWQVSTTSLARGLDEAFQLLARY